MVQKRGIMVALYGYYGYGYYYDPMYILIIISCVIALIAQVKVKSTFNKYSRAAFKKPGNIRCIYSESIRKPDR